MSSESSDGASAVYQHKFQALSGGRKLVDRRKLINRIQSNPGIPCFLIQAPAGHGKSVLLQQLQADSRSRGIQTACMKLDEADNDITRLMTHLDYMLSMVEDVAHCPSRHTDAVKSLPNSLADQVINRLLEIDAEVHLFFYDFQAIDEAEVETLFRNIITKLPQKVTLFIGSRALPKIGIPELQVNQLIELLRYDDLKFSLDEARQFFAIEDHLQLNDDELLTIYSRSEGWPAALQLFRLTLARKPVKESLNNLESYTPFQITEYLASNVLAQQHPRIQVFLLSCALLSRLNASLCQHITGRSDAQDILLLLEQQGLFLNNIDHEHCWFQFHGLFAQYLREVMRKRSVTKYRAIHDQAAHWYMEQGMHEEALHHALEAENFELATYAMDIWAGDQITNACLHSVERWAARIPFEYISKRPRLAVKITWALTFLRRRSKVLPYLDLLRTLDEENLDPQFRVERQITMAVVEMALDHLDNCFANIDPIDTDNQDATGFWAFELGAAANIKAFRNIADGNYPAARYHIALGRNLSHEGEAIFSAGYNTGLTIISCYLQGRVEEAAQRSMTALKTKGLDIEDSYAAVATVCCTLYPLYERDEADTAIRVFQQYRREIDTGLLLDFVAAAYLPMIRLYDARGDLAEAEKLLESLEDIGITANWQRLTQLCQWENVRRGLFRGELQNAAAIAAAIPKPEAPNPSGKAYLPFADAIEDPELSEIRLRVYCEPSEALLSVMQAAILDARDHNRLPRELKLHLLSALLKSKLKMTEQAEQELKLALTMAAEYGFVRSILDEGPEVLALIQSRNSDLWPTNLSRHINKLLSHAAQKDKLEGRAETAELTESLTSREMQMLSLLAKGQTNKDIARHLFVSENTVKFHLKNIFQKLNVKTRTQAISAAIALGLV
jgi:LuxR family transcriptional regulator, maltose regulon positive regulatory protein